MATIEGPQLRLTRAQWDAISRSRKFTTRDGQRFVHAHNEQTRESIDVPVVLVENAVHQDARSLSHYAGLWPLDPRD